MLSNFVQSYRTDTGRMKVQTILLGAGYCVLYTSLIAA